MTHPILQKLGSERERLVELVSSLPEEELDRQHGDGWTIREILTHLVNAEEDHCKVIALVSSGRRDRLPESFSLDEHNVKRVSERGTLSRGELLEALEAQRERTRALFDSLDEVQLEIAFRHPALGETTVGKVFRIIGLHDRLHGRDIAAALEPGA